MFEFYLKVYRSGIITFTGSKFKIDEDKNGSDAKFAQRI